MASEITPARCSTRRCPARSTAFRYTDPVFGFEVPKHCPGIPDSVLFPATAWQNEEEYWDEYRQLAARFVANFRRFAPECPPEIEMAGPITSGTPHLDPQAF
ncbi:MAG: hypothetical protein U0703_20250 [Anaerolineae bacterium]